MVNEENLDSIKNIYDFTFQFSELKQLMLDLENNIGEKQLIVSKIKNKIDLLKFAAKSINLKIEINEMCLNSLLGEEQELFEEYDSEIKTR